MMRTWVTKLETFRRWQLDESATLQDLIERLTTFEPTEAMKAGVAFHKALETIKVGDYPALECDGYTFLLPDGRVEMPEVRELRLVVDYADLKVTGRVDAIQGNIVTDWKTTSSFNPDGYFDGCQWRFYLDMFEADVFRWVIFEITPDPKAPMLYRVKPPHVLEQVRYPGLHEDCERMASEFHEFIKEHMPAQAKEWAV